MTTSSLTRGLCLATLAMLALVLAACGGSEPAPAAQPPAPPPAPPPFQPEPVEVALGTSGDKVTLMTKEGGGFTLNGEDFAGGDLAAENGATYTLTLADGKWAAAFKAAEVAVDLGSSGEWLTLMTKEGGGFTLNGTDFMGGEVMASGMTYTVTLGADGTPVAAFKPQPVAVPLGASGDSVTLLTKEGGGYTLDGEDFAGGTLAASDGNRYAVSLGDDSLWTARYQSSSVTVRLGASGGSVTVTRNEDGTYWIGETALRSGNMVTGSNGASYTLTMDDQGMWSASFNPASVTVALGTSGSVTLMSTEAGGWTLDGARILSGTSYTASNGNVYVLTMMDGAWTAAYRAMTMPIAGTGLVATSLEDGTGYQVGSATLPKSGIGDVTVDGAMYHVWRDGGMLAGARFDGAIDGDTDFKTAGLKALPTLSANDATTAANELRTKLKVAGSEFLIGELLGQGMSMARGKSFVDEARQGLQDLLLDARALIRALGESNPATLDTELKKLWGTHSASNPKNAQKYVNTLFGAGKVTLSAAQGDRQDIEGALGGLIDALSSASAFAAAAAEGGGGVFAAAKLGGSAATTAFDAVDSEATATLGMTGPTRYGTVYKNPRTHATGDKFFSRTVSTSPERWVAVTAANGTTWRGIRSVLHPSGVYHAATVYSGSGNTLGETVPTGTASDTTGAPIVLDSAPADDLASRNAVKAAVERVLPPGQGHSARVFDWGGTGAGLYFYIAIQSTGVTLSFRVYFVKVGPSGTPGEAGAFAYSTGPETDRLRFITHSGNAYYEGGTRAVTGEGTVYTGDMAISLNFTTKRVDGLVSNLRDAKGNAWRYFYGDAARIVLPSATARDSNAGVNWKASAGSRATVSYARQAGNPSPTTVAATFEGKLLGGNGGGAGSAATGVWTLGGSPAEGPSHLAGGYGVERVADRPARGPDEVEPTIALSLISAATGGASASIADGKLKLTAKGYGWTSTAVTAGGTSTTGLKWSYGTLTGAAANRTYSIDLQAAFDNEGLETTINGDRHVNIVRTQLQKVRDDLESLIGRNILPTQQGDNWRRAQFLVGTQLFGVDGTDTYASNTWSDTRTSKAAFPDKLDGNYDKDTALDLLDRVLDALSSSASLAGALKANAGGIFTKDDNQPETAVAAATLWAARESQVKTFLGITNYTRFGVWRIQNGSSAMAANNQHQREMGRFAYSALTPTAVADVTQPGYTVGTATYTGKTVAMQGTNYYVGDATLTASFGRVGGTGANANKPQGSLVAEFTNLVNAETGVPLTVSYHYTPSGQSAGVYTLNLASLVFTNIDVRNRSATSDELVFGLHATTSNRVKVTTADLSVDEITRLKVGSGNGTPTTFTVSGLFVGQDAAGPIGAIGEWSLGANAVPSSGANAGDIHIGDGSAIQAAFGVELPSP